MYVCVCAYAEVALLCIAALSKIISAVEFGAKYLPLKMAHTTEWGARQSREMHAVSTHYCIVMGWAESD